VAGAGRLWPHQVLQLLCLRVIPDLRALLPLKDTLSCNQTAYSTQFSIVLVQPGNGTILCAAHTQAVPWLPQTAAALDLGLIMTA
jgi:hypothetical protein